MGEPDAAEITRAISEIDLSALRERSGNVLRYPENTQSYTKEQLLEHRSNNTETPQGFTTPPFLVPAAPPPTPATPQESATQDTGTQETDGTTGELNAADGTVAAPAGASGVVAKKKKKKSSGKNKKAKVNPTGFEEFYADPPVTPEDAVIESDLYDPEREFHERIQTCIQRYRARRKLDEHKGNIFSKYLILGGIEATTKAFTGGALDNETLENATAEEIAALQATDFIRTGDKSSKNSKYYDPADAEKWVVDFEGVAKGFFSRIVPQRIGADTEEEIQLASKVIRNFLNYVLQHNVCPEYVEDVMAARRVCDVAEKDLTAIMHVRTELPGDFNIAASSICGGRYHGAYISAQSWQSADDPLQLHHPSHVGFSDEEAKVILNAGIAFKGSDELFVQAMKEGLRTVKSEVKAYEIVGIERADAAAIKEISTVKDHHSKPGNIKVLGTLKLKPWEGPEIDPEDYSDDEAPPAALSTEIEEFWLEDEILGLLHVGLKLQIVAHYLNIEVKYFDRIVGLYCSFHTFLENEKMQGWKEPVLNDRAPPTEDDPDIEERAQIAAMEGELDQDAKMFDDK